MRRRFTGPTILLLVVLTAFAVALILWTRGGPDTTALPPLVGDSALPVPGQSPGTATGSAAPTDGATGPGGPGGTATSTLIPPLPTDEVHTFVPGPHSVALTASSSSGRLRALGYRFRGHQATAIYNVRTPFRISDHVSGLNKLAAIGVQVDSRGGTATCSIIVDGRTIVTRSASGPGQVAVCGV